ncbi:MAG TPA: glycerophosphoryl diester phosphodiesterase membrane domain-containing protein [Chloroflexota bacterium]
MQETLSRFRPMDLGDILNTTFNLYRDNFMLFAGIVAVIVVPQAILEALLAISHSTLFVLLLALVSVAAPFLEVGALAEAVAARYLGRSITIREAFESIGWPTFLVLVGASLLAGICVLVGLVLLVIPGIYIGVRLTLVAQAAVLERRGVTDSLARSWNLVEGNWWRVFGIVLVVSILVAVLETLVSRIVGVAAGDIVGNGLGTAIVGIVFQPIQAIALTLLYFDLRIRKEGTVESGGSPQLDPVTRP